jgi:5'-methylthioadenosine phosphorylase
MLALKELGVQRVVGVNSTGSLRKSLPPKTLLVPHDYINPWRIRTIYIEEVHHITPGLNEEMRTLILETGRQMGIDLVAGGVYLQTTGPRFETKAEIHMFRSFADIVGMTMASEATIARELDMSYASVCSVDNFCHGITELPLGEAEVLSAARENAETVKQLILGILEALR